jgi:hypothetical protein
MNKMSVSIREFQVIEVSQQQKVTSRNELEPPVEAVFVVVKTSRKQDDRRTRNENDWTYAE